MGNVSCWVWVDRLSQYSITIRTQSQHIMFGVEFVDSPFSLGHCVRILVLSTFLALSRDGANRCWQRTALVI